MDRQVLEVENLSKKYEMGGRTIRALSKASFRVMRGDFVAIMGPSGSGKTTLLTLIGCMDRPTGGRIVLEGVEVTGVPEAALYRIRREKIGFIFQNFNLIESLTAIENVELPMEGLKGSRKQRRERARELLDLVGLGDRGGHSPLQLSGGEQQRVAIARSLANDPVVILADEPTGNLDSETGNSIIELLNKLASDRGCAVLVATHDSFLGSLSNRTLSLRDGRLQRNT